MFTYSYRNGTSDKKKIKQNPELDDGIAKTTRKKIIRSTCEREKERKETQDKITQSSKCKWKMLTSLKNIV